MKKKLIKGIIFTSLSMIGLVAPLLILMIINKGEWFVETEAGTKLSIGCIVALVFILCLLRGAFKDIDRRFTVIMTLGVMMVLTWLFDSIIDDLFSIILCGMIGYVLYIVTNIIGKNDLNYYKEYKNEKARIEAREEAKEEVSEEGW